MRSADGGTFKTGSEPGAQRREAGIRSREVITFFLIIFRPGPLRHGLDRVYRRFFSLVPASKRFGGSDIILPRSRELGEQKLVLTLSTAAGSPMSRL